MGVIFDIHLAKAYENWCRSPKGLRMDLFIESMIYETLKPFKHERVIDIGCGSGNHLQIAGRHGMDLSGIDASPYMLTQARNTLGNRCDLKQADAEDLPYVDNEFDLAFLINTLEFMEDPLPVILEAGRVAKRGVLIVFFNSLSLYIRWQKMRSLFRKMLFSRIKPYSLWEMKRLVTQAYGPVQMKWKSLPMSACIKKTGKPNMSFLPFGFLIGISVTLTYRYKTDNLSLKEKINGAKRPVVEGVHISHSK
jgi:ubiquinone/menaquinone biosynthesis C-methylase UbiE